MAYNIVWSEPTEGNTRRGVSDTKNTLAEAEQMAAERSTEHHHASVCEAGTSRIVQKWHNGKRADRRS